MLEDTVINEFRIKPISPEKVVSSVDGETAYSLESIPHGKCDTPTKVEEMILNIPETHTTLGVESDTECDSDPYDLITYNADNRRTRVMNMVIMLPVKGNIRRSVDLSQARRCYALFMKFMMPCSRA